LAICRGVSIGGLNSFFSAIFKGYWLSNDLSILALQ
jgi:hypothetical protein